MIFDRLIVLLPIIFISGIIFFSIVESYPYSAELYKLHWHNLNLAGIMSIFLFISAISNRINRKIIETVGIIRAGKVSHT